MGKASPSTSTSLYLALEFFSYNINIKKGKDTYMRITGDSGLQFVHRDQKNRELIELAPISFERKYRETREHRDDLLN